MHERWSRVSTDYNRYFQNFRRFHNADINYLRVVESHKDGYPHIHILIQFPDARIRVENSQYFDRAIYQRWRSLWTFGHLDYQKPRRGTSNAIAYVMKYLLKNQTQKTVWKKILRSRDVTTAIDESTSTNTKTSSFIKPNAQPPTHLHGVKLCTWSRGFDFSVFLARRPESIVKGLKPTEN